MNQHLYALSFDFAYTGLALTVIMLPTTPTYGGTFFPIDSHIQHIVLATEETMVTQQVSYRPIKCQSRSRSQRVTTVNGSHNGEIPFLKPTGIQFEVQFVLFGVLPVFQNLNFKLQRRLSDVLPNQQSHQKYVQRCTCAYCGTLSGSHYSIM